MGYVQVVLALDLWAAGLLLLVDKLAACFASVWLLVLHLVERTFFNFVIYICVLI